MTEYLSEWDRACFRRAIELAIGAEEEGNLPVGAVISHGVEIIAEGRNAIWYPISDPTRHAEMEALREIPGKLKAQAPDLTLYSTLEPCLMCRGAILLHGIGRVFYGSADPYGGAVGADGVLPTYFREAVGAAAWMGPALPQLCDPLFHRAIRLLEAKGGGEIELP